MAEGKRAWRSRGASAIKEILDVTFTNLAAPLSPIRRLSPTRLRKAPATPSAEDASSYTSPIRLSLLADEFTVRLCVRKSFDQRVCLEVTIKERYCGVPKFSDLQIRHIVGVGSFGCVKLVVDRTTNVGYALKCLRKQGMQHVGWSRAVLRERTILAAVHDKHPFVVGLIESYQDVRCVYMLLPIVSGGELSKFIKIHAPLSLPAARFYVGSVVLALEFLHSKRIVFRDLKPENLMLDQHGHCMLIDFGEQSTNNLPRTTDHQPPAFVMDASRPLL